MIAFRRTPIARHSVETAGREGFELHSREGYGVNIVLIFTCHAAPLKVRSLANRGVQRRGLLRPQYVDFGRSTGDDHRGDVRPKRKFKLRHCSRVGCLVLSGVGNPRRHRPHPPSADGLRTASSLTARMLPGAPRASPFHSPASLRRPSRRLRVRDGAGDGGHRRRAKLHRLDRGRGNDDDGGVAALEALVEHVHRA